MPPKDDNTTHDDNHYALSRKKEKVVEPLHASSKPSDDDNVALNLIRQKLNAIYEEEPNAKKELEEDAAHHGRRSKHQEFMHKLSNSGKSLAEIQTAWHNYYIELPDQEKHQVWQEFYSNYNRTPSLKRAPQQTLRPQQPVARQDSQKQETAYSNEVPESKLQRTPEDIKKHIRDTVSRRASKSKASHHASSLKFGLLTGLVVMFVMLFGFFNERFIAPLITPSTQVSSTPLIIDENGEVGSEPKLIIPKINVEVPVVYDEESIAEDAVQRALEDGVLHYPTTPEPGEIGNSVIFGHSSNNILNKGAYKFAFVLLSRLEPGDTFFIHKDGQRYTYKIYEKKVVSPEEVSVLGNAGKKASMTLITCDPPGTAINRLVVIGEQITPSPDSNVASSASTTTAAQPEILPSNAPSLWSRFTSWLSS